MGFTPGAGGGSSSVGGSTDVALSSPQNNQTLIYDSSAAKWQNESAIGPVQIAGVLNPGDLIPDDGRYYIQLDNASSGNPTISYIGSYTTTSDSTSGSITLTQSVPVGAVLVATLHGGGTGTVMTASDAGNNTWSYGSASSTAASPHSTTRIAYSRVTNSLNAGQTVTVTRGSSGGFVGHLAVLRNLNGTAGGTGTGTANTDTVTFSSVATQAPSIMVSAVTTTENVTVSGPGGGATLSGRATSSGGTQPRAGAMLHQVRTANGSVTHTLGMDRVAQEAHATLEIR